MLERSGARCHVELISSDLVMSTVNVNFEHPRLLCSHALKVDPDSEV
jgi:hypothetical protein